MGYSLCSAAFSVWFWVAFDGEITFSDVDGDFSDVILFFSDVNPKKSD
jgi:hypothetical protein